MANVLQTKVDAPYFRQQKTRVPGISCGVGCVILRLAVSVEHRVVTDRQTDRQTHDYGICRASMASRGN